MGDHVALDVVSPASTALVDPHPLPQISTPPSHDQVGDNFGSGLSILPQLVRGFGSRLSISIQNEEAFESRLSNSPQDVNGLGMRNKSDISLSPPTDGLQKADTSKTPAVAVKKTCDVIKCDDDPFSATSEGLVECRICQNEDDKQNLEAPCACSGSLKYAHRKCVQRWCDEKGNTVCEICQQTYKSGYKAPQQAVIPDSSPIELRYSMSDGHWRVESANHLGLQDPRVMAILEAEYGEYATASVKGAACFRSVALILLALLLLRHGLELASPTLDEDPFTVSIVFILKAVGFILPCYIMARVVHMLRRRRRQQEASLIATEVSILLRTAQERRMQLTIAPGPFAEHT